MTAVSNLRLALPTIWGMAHHPRLGVPAFHRVPSKVGRGTVDYPSRLMDLRRPPQELWHVGRLPAAVSRVVALVGARSASGRGCAMARELAIQTVAARGSVVSGGAFGIDAAAHEATLEAGGTTWAVLGCGVDVVYPDRHATLFSRISRDGGLLSEYPPGTPPRAGQFPARNRIIAALADVVVVVEAGYKSGAMSTASEARKLGRPLFAVPGSPGTDALLNSGRARAVRDMNDVERGLVDDEPAPVATPAPAVAAIMAALAEGPQLPGVLARRLGLPLPQVMATLTEAEMDGWIRRSAGSQYEVSRGH